MTGQFEKLLLAAPPYALNYLIEQVARVMPQAVRDILVSQEFINFLVWPLIQIAIMIGAVMTAVAYLTYLERKISAWIQVRVGPNRTGPWGLLQPAADGIKLILKEDIIPFKADKAVFTIAPMISMIAALTVLAVLPFGPLYASITNINIGLLFILSVSSVGVLGIVLGGWASNSKYPLLGGLRSSAQMISYEAAMGLAIIGGLMFTKTLSMQGIVEAQQKMGVWLVLFQLPAFVIFIFSAVAETNRAPFDLPDAESELVGGFHTEYSGFRFSIYFIGEYTAMVVVSAVGATLFLGGWYFPGLAQLHSGFLMQKLPQLADGIYSLLGVLVFAAKTGFILYLFFWLRWTFPRYRYDQLMDIGWKWLLPAALANIVLTAIFFVIGQTLGFVASKGGYIEVSTTGKLYFTAMSFVTMVPLLLLLNVINRNSKSFNLRAQRTQIRFSTRYAKPAPKPAVTAPPTDATAAEA